MSTHDATPINSETPTVMSSASSWRFVNHAPAWLRWRWLALIWLAMIAYGSLIPFDFHVEALYQQTGGWAQLILHILTSPRWVFVDAMGQAADGGSWIADGWTNLALYGPLGLFLRLGFRRRRWTRRRQVLTAAVVLLSVSYLLESTQSLTWSRVPSLIDVLANVSGGLFAALLAVHIRAAFTTVVFGVYCRITRLLYASVGALRRKRGVLYTVILVDIGLVLAWVWYVVGRSTPTSNNWLPFANEFMLPYDLAAVRIAENMIVYCLAAMLISLPLLAMNIRRRFDWLVLAMALLAALRQGIVHFEGFSPSLRADVTQWILAVGAAVVLATSAHLVAHAVRTSNRRRTDQQVAVERRRQPAFT